MQTIAPQVRQMLFRRDLVGGRLHSTQRLLFTANSSLERYLVTRFRLEGYLLLGRLPLALERPDQPLLLAVIKAVQPPRQPALSRVAQRHSDWRHQRTRVKDS